MLLPGGHTRRKTIREIPGVEPQKGAGAAPNRLENREIADCEENAGCEAAGRPVEA
jgi:hypothetical protein